jgi:hypothetical protein
MRILCPAALAFLACGSPSLDPLAQRPIDGPQVTAVKTINLQLDPNRPLDGAEPVTAIQVELSGMPSPDVLPYVVQGTVSQISLNKLADGELTSALSNRVVATVTHTSANGWRIRPDVPLLPGQVYSVISTYGEHGKFTVGQASEGYLTRVWPLPSEFSASLLGIYCGASAPVEPADIILDGSNVKARLLPALDDFNTRLGRCVRLIWGRMRDIGAQPPPAFGDYGFDPSIIPTGQLPDSPIAVQCEKGELPLGPGCAIAESGRIIVRPPPGDSLWALGFKGYAHIQRVQNGQRFVIPDLGIEPAVELVTTVFDAAGRTQSSKYVIAMPPPGPRFVINEVMSNPVGLEPTQEWIELVNAGSLDGDLSGMILKDSGIGVQLPAAVVHPGEYVLVVREDFDASLPGDVPMTEFVKLIRVPQIGQSGLSNLGESMTLFDTRGMAVSRFPAVQAKAAGVSIARREWWSLDDDLAAFRAHGGRGASPGSANILDN